MPFKDPVKRREMQRIYMARYAATPNGRAVRLRATLASHARRGPNLEQQAARMAVSRALARGLVRRLPCQVCGATKSHAHHYLGYAREHRLHVVWLCPLHHAAAHGRRIAAALPDTALR